MRSTILILLCVTSIMAKQSIAQEMGTFTDTRDGHIYKSVKIGTQTWMAENLAYRVGGGNYWAPKNKAANIALYGYFYDWGNAKVSCPVGWHLPSDAEWTKLTNFLGYEDSAGYKMRVFAGWKLQKGNRNMKPEEFNSSGFSALPVGMYITREDMWDDYGLGCDFWSSTESDNTDAFVRSMICADGKVRRKDYPKSDGVSVRCIQNGNEIELNQLSSDEALAALKKAKDKLDLGLISQHEYDSLKLVYSKIIK